MPDDLADTAVEKAAGIVELPLHVRWSGPSKVYDLADRRDQVRVYEQVLREGTADDIRRFIDLDELIASWDDLVLPRYVRSAWAAWFRRQRPSDLAR